MSGFTVRKRMPGVLRNAKKLYIWKFRATAEQVFNVVGRDMAVHVNDAEDVDDVVVELLQDGGQEVVWFVVSDSDSEKAFGLYINIDPMESAHAVWNWEVVSTDMDFMVKFLENISVHLFVVEKHEWSPADGVKTTEYVVTDDEEDDDEEDDDEEEDPEWEIGDVVMLENDDIVILRSSLPGNLFVAVGARGLGITISAVSIDHKVEPEEAEDSIISEFGLNGSYLDCGDGDHNIAFFRKDGVLRKIECVSGTEFSMMVDGEWWQLGECDECININNVTLEGVFQMHADVVVRGCAGRKISGVVRGLDDDGQYIVEVSDEVSFDSGYVEEP